MIIDDVNFFQLLGRDRVIRDVKPVGDRLIFASGTEIHVVDREPQFLLSNQTSEYCHIVHRVMNAHRRDISCLDVVEGNPKIVASGSKDRKLIVWCLEVSIIKKFSRQQLNLFEQIHSYSNCYHTNIFYPITIQTGKVLDYVADAHERLITCVKFLQKPTTSNTQTALPVWPIFLFTSSRDRRVKMWKFKCNESQTKSYDISLVQTIEGHVHSVWDVDCTLQYLVAGSADKTIRVWENNMGLEVQSNIGKPILLRFSKIDIRLV